MRRISLVTRSPRLGVKPTSRITANAATNMTTRTAALRTNGTPRLVTWAMYPPATDPVNMPTPVTTCPRPSTDSRLPSKPVAFRASTSHASTAPEKNVNPSPSATETSAQDQNGASTCHSRT